MGTVNKEDDPQSWSFREELRLLQYMVDPSLTEYFSSRVGRVADVLDLPDWSIVCSSINGEFQKKFTPDQCRERIIILTKKYLFRGKVRCSHRKALTQLVSLGLRRDHHSYHHQHNSQQHHHHSQPQHSQSMVPSPPLTKENLALATSNLSKLSNLNELVKSWSAWWAVITVCFHTRREIALRECYQSYQQSKQDIFEKCQFMERVRLGDRDDPAILRAHIEEYGASPGAFPSIKSIDMDQINHRYGHISRIRDDAEFEDTYGLPLNPSQVSLTPTCSVNASSSLAAKSTIEDTTTVADSRSMMMMNRSPHIPFITDPTAPATAPIIPPPLSTIAHNPATSTVSPATAASAIRYGTPGFHAPPSSLPTSAMSSADTTGATLGIPPPLPPTHTLTAGSSSSNSNSTSMNTSSMSAMNSGLTIDSLAQTMLGQYLRILHAFGNTFSEDMSRFDPQFQAKVSEYQAQWKSAISDARWSEDPQQSASLNEQFQQRWQKLRVQYNDTWLKRRHQLSNEVTKQCNVIQTQILSRVSDQELAHRAREKAMRRWKYEAERSLLFQNPVFIPMTSDSVFVDSDGRIITKSIRHSLASSRVSSVAAITPHRSNPNRNAHSNHQNNTNNNPNNHNSSVNTSSVNGVAGSTSSTSSSSSLSSSQLSASCSSSASSSRGSSSRASSEQSVPMSTDSGTTVASNHSTPLRIEDMTRVPSLNDSSSHLRSTLDTPAAATATVNTPVRTQSHLMNEGHKMATSAALLGSTLSVSAGATNASIMPPPTHAGALPAIPQFSTQFGTKPISQ